MTVCRVQTFSQHLELKVADEQAEYHQHQGEIEQLREDVCLWDPGASVAYGGNKRVDVIKRNGDTVA